MKISKRNNIIIVAVAFMIFLLTLIDYISIRRVTAERVLMDTAVRITVYGLGRDRKKLEIAVEEAFGEIARVESLMSSYITDSDVSRINNAGGAFVAISAETANILETAKRVGELTDGAFDVTLGRVMKLWDFTGSEPTVPDESTVNEILTGSGNDKIEVTYNDATETYYAQFTDTRAMLDLGGIAKGHAIKQAARLLRARGVKSGIIDAGGDIVVIGNKKGKPFKVGIRSPDGDGILSVIKADDTSIVTSGDYERGFVQGGVLYHHILDPKTGFPAGGTRSVTVVTHDPTIADALSTALFVMGSDTGIALVDQLDGVEAIFIDDTGVTHLSKGAAGILEPKE